jgi:hypothetical protein
MRLACKRLEHLTGYELELRVQRLRLSRKRLRNMEKGMRAVANHLIDRAERWPNPIVVLVAVCLLMTAAAVWM